MWVVSVHDGGGSMAEAVEPIWTVAMVNKKSADELRDMLNNWFSNLGHHDTWANAFEVLSVAKYDLPQITDPAELKAQLGGQPKPGEIAVDVRKLARMLAEGETPNMKPPEPEPLSAEEEQAAIQSLLGGTS